MMIDWMCRGAAAAAAAADGMEMMDRAIVVCKIRFVADGIIIMNSIAL